MHEASTTIICLWAKIYAWFRITIKVNNEILSLYIKRETYMISYFHNKFLVVFEAVSPTHIFQGH